MSSHKINHKLLENGLAFVKESIDLVKGSPQIHELRHAIILFSIGLELIVKDCLISEHWAFVFNEPKDASLDKWKSGDFISAGFEVSLNRYERLKGIDLHHRKGWESIRKNRNKLEHFGIVAPPEAMKAAIAIALNSLFDFTTDHIGQNRFTTTEKKLYNEIKLIATQFDRYVDERLKHVEDLLLKAKTLLTCNRCGHEAAIIDNGLECKMCDYILTPHDAVKEYLNVESLTWHCPFCGNMDTFIECSDTQYEYICFDCGQTAREHELDKCYGCGCPIRHDYSYCASCTEYDDD